jgi:hypothetical protein
MGAPLIDKFLTALSVAAASADSESFGEALKQASVAGAPLVEIARAIEMSPWRYEISQSGGSLRWAHLDELEENYSELYSGVKGGASALGANRPGGGRGFRSLNVREPLGVSCFELSAESDRIGRYLLPHEDRPLAAHHIAEALKEGEFSWDGGFEVERYPGENAKLLRDAIAFYAE